MIRLIVKKSFHEENENMVWVAEQDSNGKRKFGRVIFDIEVDSEGLLPNTPSFVIEDTQLERVIEKNPYKILTQEIERLTAIIYKLMEKK